jgi:FecR protein
MKPLRVLALTLVCACLPSFAQQVISAKSGLLSYVEGNVTLNGEPADFSGVHFSDVKENSVVRTADGRAEVLLTPGVVLRMGENTSLRMISNRLVDTRLELLTGSAVVEADQIAKDTSVTIVCKDGVVTLPKAGLYRFDTEPAQVKVFKGDADVEVAGNTQDVSGGHLLGLSNGAATLARFNVDDTDNLDRWSHRRGSYLAMANASAANSLVSSSGVSGIYGAGGYGFGGYGLTGWGMQGCSSAWAYNMYYNMMTYMPCYGSLWSPYGYRFWSPYTIYRYNGFAPPIYGGGAGRTGASPSGSASLARPVATASNRANSPAASLGSSHAGFSNGAGAGRVGTTSAITSGSGGGALSGGGGGGGFSGGGHAGGAGAGGGGHGGGGGHR